MCRCLCAHPRHFLVSSGIDLRVERLATFQHLEMLRDKGERVRTTRRTYALSSALHCKPRAKPRVCAHTFFVDFSHLGPGGLIDLIRNAVRAENTKWHNVASVRPDAALSSRSFVRSLARWLAFRRLREQSLGENKIPPLQLSSGNNRGQRCALWNNRKMKIISLSLFLS